MRSIALLAIVVCGLLLSAPTLWAQLNDGDALIASNTGLTLIRNGVAAPVAPSPTDGNAIVPASFGNGSIAIVLGTNRAVYAEGAGSFGLYLLDFSGTTGTPASTLLGNASAGVPGLTYDAASDALFGVTTSGQVFRIPGPIDATSSPDPSPFATGQAGAITLAAAGPGQLLAADQAQVWAISAGDVSPSSPLISLPSTGVSDLAYDAGDDRLFVATFGGSTVDAYRLGTGEFLDTLLMAPSLNIVDGVDYDPRDDRLYAMSRLAPTLGGASWGSQISFDNVLVCRDAAGLTAPVGCSPQTGHGNAGLNAAMAVARGPVIRLELDASSSSTIFDAASGTVTASGTIIAVNGSIPTDDPLFDALVGANIAFDASFFGTDLIGLSDVGLTALDLRIFQAALPPSPADIQLTTPLSANTGSVSSFGGATGATALVSRRFSLVQPISTNNLAMSSPITQRLAAAVPGGTVTLDFDVTSGNLTGVGVNLNARPAEFDLRLGTSGQGDLVLGSLGAPPFARLFHLATPLLSVPTGSGPFLGLAPDFGIIDQLNRPLGAEPFHVLAGPNGTYRFGLPTGAIPAGTSIDFRGIAWDVSAGTLTLSRPRTITF